MELDSFLLELWWIVSFWPYDNPLFFIFVSLNLSYVRVCALIIFYVVIPFSVPLHLAGFVEFALSPLNNETAMVAEAA